MFIFSYILLAFVFVTVLTGRYSENEDQTWWSSKLKDTMKISITSLGHQRTKPILALLQLYIQSDTVVNQFIIFNYYLKLCKKFENAIHIHVFILKFE